MSSWKNPTGFWAGAFAALVCVVQRGGRGGALSPVRSATSVRSKSSKIPVTAAQRFLFEALFFRTVPVGSLPLDCLALSRNSHNTRPVEVNFEILKNQKPSNPDLLPKKSCQVVTAGFTVAFLQSVPEESHWKDPKVHAAFSTPVPFKIQCGFQVRFRVGEGPEHARSLPGCTHKKRHVIQCLSGGGMGRRQRIRTQCGTWNPKPHNFKPRRGGWVVVVKVETADVGAERCPAAIGSDSC